MNQTSNDVIEQIKKDMQELEAITGYNISSIKIEEKYILGPVKTYSGSKPSEDISLLIIADLAEKSISLRKLEVGTFLGEKVITRKYLDSREIKESEDLLFWNGSMYLSLVIDLYSSKGDGNLVARDASGREYTREDFRHLKKEIFSQRLCYLSGHKISEEEAEKLFDRIQKEPDSDCLESGFKR